MSRFFFAGIFRSCLKIIPQNTSSFINRYRLSTASVVNAAIRKLMKTPTNSCGSGSTGSTTMRESRMWSRWKAEVSGTMNLALKCVYL